jgi:two-component SAPR family response regulator/Flp pilus assembly protein TadD
LAKFIDPETFPFIAHISPKLKKNYPLEIPVPEAFHADKDRLFAAIAGFLLNLSRTKPLLLLLDDIQWMDADSVALIQYLASKTEDESVLIVGASRPWAEGSPVQQMVDGMLQRRKVHLVDLDNITRSDTSSLIRTRFDGSVPAPFGAWLYSITRGNPLFISEVLNVLLRRNILTFKQAGGGWMVKDDYTNFPLSPTIESIITLRLRNLTSPARSLLEIASVLAGEFEIAMLRAMEPGLAKERFLKSIHQLEGEKLLEEMSDGRMRFAHPLIQEVVYREIERGKRRSLHRKAGALLEKQFGDADERIAYHVTVDLKDEEKTPELARLLLRAANRLIRACSDELAYRYFALAKDIAKRYPQQLEKEAMACEAGLFRLRWVLGKDPPPEEHMETLVEELRQAGLKRDAVTLYRILFYRAMTELKVDKAEGYLNSALSIAKSDEEDYWVLRVEDCLLKRRQGKFKEAEKEANRLIESIDPQIAPGALWKVLHNLGAIAHARGDLKEARDLMQKALKVAHEWNLQFYFIDTSVNLGLIEMDQGLLDSALEKLTKAVEEAECSQRPQKLAAALIILGRCCAMRGDYKAALTHFARALERAQEIEFRRAIAAALIAQAEALLDMDNEKDAHDCLEQVPGADLPKGMLCGFLLLKSRILMRRGMPDEAERINEESLNVATQLDLNIHRGCSLAQRAVIAARNGDNKRAIETFNEARNILLQWNGRAYLGPILIRCGLAIQGKKGEEIVQEGLRLLGEMNAAKRIESVIPKIKEHGFENAYRYILDRGKRVFSPGDTMRVYTFGGLSVKRRGEASTIAQGEWQSRKAKELFGLILVLGPSGRSTREILASHLWPEADMRSSQANFRVTLARLNNTLASDSIRGEAEFVHLDHSDLWIDFFEFEKLYEQWGILRDQAKLHAAEKMAREGVALYVGDFLPEFYSTPIDHKQMELKEKAKRLLHWLTQRSRERLDWHEAISLSRRLVTLDPIGSEAGHRTIMEGLWQLGDRVGAIRQFERLKRTLKDELEIDPSPETIDLYEKIAAKGS